MRFSPRRSRRSRHKRLDPRINEHTFASKTNANRTSHLSACHPSMTTSGAVKCSRSGQMRPAGNAVQRAAQAPSLSPLPQEVLLLGLGLGLGLLLFLLFCFMTLELAGYY